MKITRTFTAPVSEATARERIILFLAQAGYNQQPASLGRLKFTRGSIPGSYANFNPKSWATTITVSMKSEPNWATIYVVADITTDPTEARFGEELLTAETSLLESAVTVNEFKNYDITSLKKRVYVQVRRIVGIFGFVLFSVILAIIIGQYISKTTDVTILGSAAIGAGVLLIMGSIFMIAWGRQKSK